MKNNNFTTWINRIKFLKDEFPFGPITQFTNEDGKLHKDDGPAFISPTRITYYKNGRKHGVDADIHGSINYYYENVRVPPKFITNPESLTIDEVLQHQNAEVRHVGIKIIGLDKLLDHPNTTIIHQSRKKGQILFQISGVFSQPVSYIKVVNSTPEPDGSFKNYYLCVPPSIKTCKSAVAWTFGLNAKNYHPSIET